MFNPVYARDRWDDVKPGTECKVVGMDGLGYCIPLSWIFSGFPDISDVMPTSWAARYIDDLCLQLDSFEEIEISSISS